MTQCLSVDRATPLAQALLCTWYLGLDPSTVTLGSLASQQRR